MKVTFLLMKWLNLKNDVLTFHVLMLKFRYRGSEGAIRALLDIPRLSGRDGQENYPKPGLFRKNVWGLIQFITARIEYYALLPLTPSWICDEDPTFLFRNLYGTQIWSGLIDSYLLSCFLVTSYHPLW